MKTQLELVAEQFNTLPKTTEYSVPVLLEIPDGILVMKKSLREKFNQNVNFVKPLYRKVKFGNGVKPMTKLIVSVDINKTNPCGDAIHVKRKIVKDKNVDCNVINFKTNKNSDNHRTLPGTCENKYQKTYTKFKCDRNESKVNTRPVYNREYVTCDLFDLEYGKMEYNKDVDGNTRNSKFVQAKNSLLLIEKVPVTWLRVYPAPQTHDESALSVVFRCVVCQLGLAAFLVLWTVLWVFVIHSFEGQYETEVSLQFEKEQNQLVIDLATELRQITPLSPKWKNAIERRIEDERLITMKAMARGAKLHPGQFWDLSGTLLFSVYVMTALGFGAPVPQTIWGRTSALIYAVLAVPTQIYLMLNASTCLIAKSESYIERARARLRDRKSNLYGKTTVDNKESPNCSRNSELIKDPRRAGMLRRKMARLLSILYLGRCVPLATLLYYVAGVVAFGVLRGRAVLETLLFPLEFTTTGGLENVEGPVRIAYGLYVEGAMFLLACALAALRAHSGAAFVFVSDKYRLFTVHERS